jgi:hypothetical protein
MVVLTIFIVKCGSRLFRGLLLCPRPTTIDTPAARRSGGLVEVVKSNLGKPGLSKHRAAEASMQ